MPPNASSSDVCRSQVDETFGPVQSPLYAVRRCEPGDAPSTVRAQFCQGKQGGAVSNCCHRRLRSARKFSSL